MGPLAKEMKSRTRGVIRKYILEEWSEATKLDSYSNSAIGILAFLDFLNPTGQVMHHQFNV
jgi:hypothetical protein